MAQQYQIRYTRTAASQLQEVFDFIAQDSPRNAARMIAKILDAIDALEILPHRYRVVQDGGALSDEVRSMPVRPYLIRYHVDDRLHVVTILSVRHGARQPEI